MTITPRIISLQQSVRESRLGIAREYAGLMNHLDVQKRFQNSFRNHPVRWISGAAAAGILTALLRIRVGSRGRQSPPANEPPVQSFLNSGWLAGGIKIGKLLFPILQPFIKEWIGSVAQSALAKKSRSF